MSSKRANILTIAVSSAATNNQKGEGVAIKKVTNVFSKKILAKRALREIKLLQHFRGHRNVSSTRPPLGQEALKREDSKLIESNRSPVSMTWTYLDPTTSMRRTSTKVTLLHPAAANPKLNDPRIDGM